jgi:hypothetical protein
VPAFGVQSEDALIEDVEKNLKFFIHCIHLGLKVVRHQHRPLSGFYPQIVQHSSRLLFVSCFVCIRMHACVYVCMCVCVYVCEEVALAIPPSDHLVFGVDAQDVRIDWFASVCHAFSVGASSVFD